ncbi:ABC transporter permease [Microvirga pudoricolor]|uniref:ABC transporter permease n=1 Tax=Microvirga pudoricolor TaxID=2778729 RepID=UPI00194F5E74|nr:ABC transporter permease [Microvirga pudoricolor]MBM6596367.1 ABC transporter permease [Microvirga pudoricolor]
MAAVTATFIMLRIAPGDPIAVLLGDMASDAEIADARQAYGLDLPIWQQLMVYLGRASTLDFGQSIAQGTSVRELVLSHFPHTLLLAASTMLVVIILALPIGIYTAVRKGQSASHATNAASLVALSLPEFWTGIVMILIFSRMLRWLPSGGAESGWSLIMPTITLALPLIAVNLRLMSTETINVLRAPYITMARARGLPRGSILRRHVIRNALIPVVTVGGIQLGHLLGGAVIVETVFNWPGVGQLLIRSIGIRDYPVVQGCLILMTFSVIVTNMLVDFAYRLIDPRFRRG